MQEFLVFSALVSGPAPDFTGIPHEEPIPQVASYSAMPNPGASIPGNAVQLPGYVQPLYPVWQAHQYPMGNVIHYPTPGVVGQSPFYGSNYPTIGTPTHAGIVGQQYPIHNPQVQGQHLTTYAPIAGILYSEGRGIYPGISNGGIVPPQSIIRLSDGCLTGA